MVSRKRGYRELAAALSLLMLALMLVASGPAFGAPHAGLPATGAAASPAGDNSKPANVKTGSDAAQARISSTLRNRSGTVDITVYHDVKAKAALRRIAPELATRGYTMPDGSTVSIGKVDASKLVKLAGVAGVRWISGNGDRQPARIGPEGPGDPVVQPVDDFKSEAQAKGLKPVSAVVSDGYGKPSAPARPDDWWDVGDGHKARQAWANGYDGDGVVVAVVDSGTDFGTPDLQGTYARINTPGPYNGWPFAYDDLANAYWELFGFAQTVNNWNTDFTGGFVNTSRTVAAPLAVTTTAVITRPFWNHGITSTGVSRVYTLPTTSRSGQIHTGFHPDAALGRWWMADGAQPAIVVVDEATAGVYDAVYIDLDDSRSFEPYERVDKANPVAALDWNGDGLADQSSGLLFWISDGVNANPGAYIWAQGEPAAPRIAGAGNLVAFMFVNTIDTGDHGQLCASSVVAQGRSRGADIFGNAPPAYKPAGTGGMVWGTANKAKVLAMRGVYDLDSGDLDFNLYAALGPDGNPATDDGAQISSNSYGNSSVDNEGWDEDSRSYGAINYYINPNIVFMVSTGNGAAGYGTITGLAGANTVVGVGASTTYGQSLVFDTITSTGQIRWGDTMSWSGIGPSSTGRWGPSVNANGAWGAGNTVVNEVGNGNRSYDSAWGGTSKAAPTAAGVMALVYDAFRTRTGRWPTYSEARNILMSTSDDNGHDVYRQGAGVINALRATNAAAGAAGALTVSPSAWQPGSFRGVTYGQDQNFMNVMTTGVASTGVFTLTNNGGTASTATMRATTLQAAQVLTFNLTTNRANESTYSGNRPDYIVTQFTSATIPADTTLMTVQQVYPFEQFNPALNYSSSPDAWNTFRLFVYDWTDVNGDGNLWTDNNGNGTVNPGEIDIWEYMRFNYGYNRHTTQFASVGYPAARMHSGIVIGVAHRDRLASVPSANITIRVTFYRELPWSWLSLSSTSGTVGANGNLPLVVTATVPAGTQVGMYEGSIEINSVAVLPNGAEPVGNISQVPVSIAVAGGSATLTFAGRPEQGTPYDNNVVYGYNDWSWRAESGDWRFYNADVPDAEAGPGNFWLVNTRWYNYAVPTSTIPTDLDTYLYGPAPDDFSNDDPARYGPYTLSHKGGSNRTYLGSGRWTFQTATGTTEEWVSGELAGGLNQIQVRTTVFNGRLLAEPFSGRSGVLSVSSGIPITVTTNPSSGCFSFSISSTLPISPLVVVAGGLSAPVTSTVQVRQSESVTRSFTLTNPMLLDVRTRGIPGSGASDVDLYVYRVVGGNLVEVGASEGSTSDEQIVIRAPGPGEYVVELYGFTVAPSPAPVELIIANVSGTGLRVSSPPTNVGPGQPQVVHLVFDQNLPPGTYYGAVMLGPAGAETAVYIPITIVIRGQTVPAGCTEPFADVNNADWFKPHVEWMYCLGYISGYSDNTFRPYNNVTRGQLTKMVMLATGTQLDNPATPTFVDVPPTDPFYTFIETAVRQGIISGYSDKTFRPYNEVTRGQTAKIVVNARCFPLVAGPGAPHFSDVPPSNPFYIFIEVAHARGIISGYADGTFRWGNPATRAQVAKMVFVAFTQPIFQPAR